MSNRLGLYNGALVILRERKLLTLTDDTPSRHALDLVFDDVVLYMLEQGYWNHAQRSVALTADPDVTTPFGFNNAFEQPEDMIRLTKISSSDRFYPTLDRYLDEGRYFFADVSIIYVMYVSKGLGYGLDLTRWPTSFARAVEAELAYRVAPSISKASSADMDRIDRERLRYLRDAKSKDAMRQPSEQMQPGRLATARHSGRSSGRGIWDI